MKTTKYLNTEYTARLNPEETIEIETFKNHMIENLKTQSDIKRVINSRDFNLEYLNDMIKETPKKIYLEKNKEFWKYIIRKEAYQNRINELRI